MSFIFQCALGGLSAIGLCCIIRAIYDIIYMAYYAKQDCAELYLTADGADARVLQLLRTAYYIRKYLLKGTEITFVDTCFDVTDYNYAQNFCVRRNIAYYR